ncbi:uncharacterized protein LOC134848586 [Symsagittifera roscoffensis]|uniref:uncharacterized protein LOC134848586 n=1 Tax=Symsagittifera roscoffensis TaxID=84072 RepID=UPI00307C9A6A
MFCHMSRIKVLTSISQPTNQPKWRSSTDIWTRSPNRKNENKEKEGEDDYDYDDIVLDGFKLDGDVAVVTDTSASKLVGILQVKTNTATPAKPDKHKNEFPSRDENNNKTLMSEHHHKAQEHFIPGANANNSPGRAQKGDSVPEYVAGTQIVECQRPSSSKSKYRQDQNQMQKPQSKLEQTLLDKYLDEIQNTDPKGSLLIPLSITTDEGGGMTRGTLGGRGRVEVGLTVDTKGVVGYVEELKRRGLVKGSFKTPTFWDGSRIYGDPKMQLASEDSNVSTMTIPAPKQFYTSRTNQELKKSLEQNRNLTDKEMTTEVQLNTSIAQSEDHSQTLPIDMKRLLLSEQNTTLSIDEAQMNNRINAIKKTQTLTFQETKLEHEREKSWSNNDHAKNLRDKGEFRRRRSRTFASLSTFKPNFDSVGAPVMTSLSTRNYSVAGVPIRSNDILADTNRAEYRLSNINKNYSSPLPEDSPLKKYRLVRAEKQDEQIWPPSKPKKYEYYRRPSNLFNDLPQQRQSTKSRNDSPLSDEDALGNSPGRRTSVVVDLNSNIPAAFNTNRRRSSMLPNDMTLEEAARANRELKKRLDELRSEIKTDAEEFGRKVEDEVKQKTKELEKQRQKQAAKILRQRKIDEGRLKQIAATGFIHQAFQSDKLNKKLVNKATKKLQGWIRGVLLRLNLERAKKQAASSFGNFNKFYKHYFILTRKIQTFYGESDFQINPTMKQLMNYLQQRNEYEQSLRRVIGTKSKRGEEVVRPPQLEMALNRLDKYPCSQEIQRAVLQAHQPAADAPYEPYSCFMKFSLRDALDACFFIYVPDNIGLKPSAVRISTWMDPIVNGIEVRKYLSDPNYLPEKKVPYEKCLDAVMNMMFEQQLKPPDKMFGPNAYERIMEKREKIKAIKL